MSFSTPDSANWKTGIYGITDAHLMPDDHTLFQRVSSALKAGLALLQYRDKSEDPVKRLRQAKLLKALCSEYQVPLVINDDLSLAEKLGVGVHLGQEDGSIRRARQILGKHAIIGATCHDSIALAQEALDEGASYLAFGRFFPSQTKPNARQAPLSLLEKAKYLGSPIVAIGGIEASNAYQLVASGVDLLAVVHAIFATDDPEQAVLSLKKAMKG